MRPKPTRAAPSSTGARGSRRAGWAALGAIATLTATTTPARGNGRFPASNQIVFSPVDEKTMVGRTTFGFLPSTDDGATWRWVCEDVLALPADMVSDPELALTAGGALVAGIPEPYGLGVSSSHDLGCNWGCAGALGDRPVADIVLRPSSPRAVLALIQGTIGDGGASPTQVFESTDDGTSWAPLGAPIDTSDPALFVWSIDVARSDPSRIYVSATRGGGPTRTASLFESTDDARTWTEHPLSAFDATHEEAIYIGGVDPTDPDRVYARSGGITARMISANASCDASHGSSRLFLTTTGGASFREVVTPISPACQILGFALSSDGSRVYVGSFGDGVFAGARSDLKFTKTSSIHVECLATRGKELWACSDAASGFIFGSSTDEGLCFHPSLPLLNNLSGPLSCPATPGGPLACHAKSNGSVCTVVAFKGLCDLPFSMPADCFVDAAPTSPVCTLGDAGAPTPASRSTGCGCAFIGDAGGAAGSAAGGLMLLAGAATMHRRRRRA